MKTLFVILIIVALASCGNNNKKAAATADSSNMITDSAALKNTDTTKVIGANKIGQGQMRTDTVVSGAKQ